MKEILWWYSYDMKEVGCAFSTINKTTIMNSWICKYNFKYSYYLSIIIIKLLLTYYYVLYRQSFSTRDIVSLLASNIGTLLYQFPNPNPPIISVFYEEFSFRTYNKLFLGSWEKKHIFFKPEHRQQQLLLTKIFTKEQQFQGRKQIKTAAVNRPGNKIPAGVPRKKWLPGQPDSAGGFDYTNSSNSFHELCMHSERWVFAEDSR